MISRPAAERAECNRKARAAVKSSESIDQLLPRPSFGRAHPFDSEKDRSPYRSRFQGRSVSSSVPPYHLLEGLHSGQDSDPRFVAGLRPSMDVVGPPHLPVIPTMSRFSWGAFRHSSPSFTGVTPTWFARWAQHVTGNLSPDGLPLRSRFSVGPRMPVRVGRVRGVALLVNVPVRGQTERTRACALITLTVDSTLSDPPSSLAEGQSVSGSTDPLRSRFR